MQREMIIGKNHMKDIFIFVNGEGIKILNTPIYRILFYHI